MKSKGGRKRAGRSVSNDFIHRERQGDPRAGVLEVAAHLLHERHDVSDLSVRNHAQDHDVVGPGAGDECLQSGEDRGLVREESAHSLGVDDGGSRDAEIDESGKNLIELLAIVQDRDQQAHG